MPDLIPPHGGLTEPVNRTVATTLEHATADGRRCPAQRRRPVDASTASATAGCRRSPGR